MQADGAPANGAATWAECSMAQFFAYGIRFYASSRGNTTGKYHPILYLTKKRVIVDVGIPDFIIIAEFAF
jgi:hypothetical protein